MGIFDTIELPAEFALPCIDRDPSTFDWQTKSIGMPAMRTFRITRDGRLLQKEFCTEPIPEAEQSDDGDDTFPQLAPSVRHEHDGWSIRRYHGTIRIVTSVEGELLEYTVKFTDGCLRAVSESGPGREGEWIPVETVLEDVPTGPSGESTSHSTPLPKTRRRRQHTGERIAYKRTMTTPLLETAAVYDCPISPDVLTDSDQEERFVQLLHLPDVGTRRDGDSGASIPDRQVYEVVVRDPVRIEESDDGSPTPISDVLERHGPYGPDRAFQRVLELATSKERPIHRDIASLRPDHWSDIADWVTCPDCGGHDIMLVTNLDESDLTLACRACDARCTSAEREALFHDWLHCPSCASGDINIELSAPHGSVGWSCDDCGYDTRPASIDDGYTEARIGDPSSGAGQ